MALNDTEVQRQIEQMVVFIKQEAEEKASEIMVKAEEEFNIEKARLVQEEKLKIMKEYERKRKQVEVQKRISYSNQVNKSRLRTLRAQNDLVLETFAETKNSLGKLSQDSDKYAIFLKDLLVEGLIKLWEDKIELLCRKCDQEILKPLVPQAVEIFKQKSGKECVLHLNTKQFLPPPPSPSNEGNSCAGGFVMSVNRGKIILSNTLDQRLELTIDLKLPDVRKKLFNE